MTTAFHPESISHNRADAAWFLSGSLGPGGAVTDVPVNPTPFVVGRKTDCSLCLAAPTVSGQHATISMEGERLLITDLASTNGTYVNGHRIKQPTILNDNDLIQLADAPFRVRAHVAQTDSQTQPENAYNDALALVGFDRLMSARLVAPRYQPIFDLGLQAACPTSQESKSHRSQHIVGYEILGRSDLPGLETPAAMFQAADRLDLQVPLSRMLRREGVIATRNASPPPCLFVNTHPCELDDSGLIDSLQELRRLAPTQDLVLEIHESAVTDLSAMHRLAAVLRDLDMGLAFDDFGAGQTRLVELIEVRPDYVKFDMSLVRDIDTARQGRRQVLRQLVAMVRELGSTPLAEGIERLGELETCRQIGFSLGQGYFLGVPQSLEEITGSNGAG